MESIKEALAALAVSCAVGGVVWLTVPSGNMEKTMRTVVGLFVCCVAVTPFLNPESIGTYKEFVDISFDARVENEGLSELVSLQYEQAVKEEVGRVVGEALSVLEISARSVSVETEVMSDGCININSICIFLEDEHSRLSGAVKSAVEQKTGIPVEVKTQ